MINRSVLKDDVDPLRIALLDRMRWRRSVCNAMAFSFSPEHATEISSCSWNDVPLLLSSIEKSHCAGVPVEQAFSSKIPYGLDNTIPPKPIVKLSFGEAFDIMTCLGNDCMEATRVLSIQENRKPSNLLVG